MKNYTKILNDMFNSIDEEHNYGMNMYAAKGVPTVLHEPKDSTYYKGANVVKNRVFSLVPLKRIYSHHITKQTRIDSLMMKELESSRKVIVITDLIKVTELWVSELSGKYPDLVIQQLTCNTRKEHREETLARFNLPLNNDRSVHVIFCTWQFFKANSLLSKRSEDTYVTIIDSRFCTGSAIQKLAFVYLSKRKEHDKLIKIFDKHYKVLNCFSYFKALPKQFEANLAQQFLNL